MLDLIFVNALPFVKFTNYNARNEFPPYCIYYFDYLIQFKEVTLGSGTGLQFGSSGGMKLEAMKDSGMLKISSTSGFKLGSSGSLNLRSGLKSESAAVSEPASGGFKLGASGDLKLGSSSDSKLVSSSFVNFLLSKFMLSKILQIHL